MSPFEIERLSLYATPLAAVAVAEAGQLNAALAPRILQAWPQAESDGALTWMSEPKPLQAEDQPLAQLARIAGTLAEAMAAPPSWAEPGRGTWDGLWFAEAAAPGQGQPVHDFPRADWCACYLVDDGGAGSGESGEVELLDPRGAAVLMYAPDLGFEVPGGDTLGISQTVKLASGSLLVFPAWMRQGTAVNEGSRPRLSIKLLLTRRAPAYVRR